MWSFKLLILFVGVATSLAETCGDWDHLVFTRQWAQAVCLENERSREVPCCYIPDGISDWTIHGVWPSKGTEKKPTNCATCAAAFDPSKITSLESALNKTWPTLFPVADGSHKFWKHEWEKHGRCGVDVKALKDEYNYFSTGMEMHRLFSIDQVLRRSAIVPSETNLYAIQEYVKVLKDGFGAQPVIQCFHDKHLNKQYVVQIELCLSRNLHPIDCPPTSFIKNATEMCIMNMPLSYPPIQSNTQFPPNCEKQSDDTLYFVPAP